MTEALICCFSDHHRFMVRLFPDRIDARSADIDRLTQRIETALVPFRLVRELLISIAGFSTPAADVFIAETGADMSAFPTAARFASWARTVPGSNESADRIRSTKTRPGNAYLKGALGVAALAVSKTTNTYHSADNRRIMVHRGRSKPISRSNTPCSLPPVTCQLPANSIVTQVSTISSAALPARPKPAPSAISQQPTRSLRIPSQGHPRLRCP
ncbi:IS110 family transposase [Paeniglutamicibacter antarcticus]|uniref:IS110 family transposase n=1 Tax=Arthrobacter terrae TaxID=2935737 RepID=A0A931CVR0_9MICC|nr:IS110 family transposase [Arthrobacter terrae]